MGWTPRPISASKPTWDGKPPGSGTLVWDKTRVTRLNEEKLQKFKRTKFKSIQRELTNSHSRKLVSNGGRKEIRILQTYALSFE